MYYILIFILERVPFQICFMMIKSLYVCVCEDTHTTNLSNAWWWFDNLGCQKQKQKKNSEKLIRGWKWNPTKRERKKRIWITHTHALKKNVKNHHLIANNYHDYVCLWEKIHVKWVITAYQSFNIRFTIVYCLSQSFFLLNYPHINPVFFFIFSLIWYISLMYKTHLVIVIGSINLTMNVCLVLSVVVGPLFSRWTVFRFCFYCLVNIPESNGIFFPFKILFTSHLWLFSSPNIL